MVARDYAEAATRFGRVASAGGPRRAHFAVQQAFTLVLAGKLDEARVILTGLPTAAAMDPQDQQQAQEIVRWLARALP
jgi:ABC-type hemin transport system ATPase subunit